MSLYGSITIEVEDTWLLIEESIEKWTRILISAGRTLKQDISMKLVENHPRKT